MIRYILPEDIQQRVINLTQLPPSAFIDTVAKDIQKVEESERFSIDMGTWFSTIPNVAEDPSTECHVCAAGAVMMGTLGADFEIGGFFIKDHDPARFTFTDMDPSLLEEYYNHLVGDRLHAADSIRQMNVCAINEGLYQAGFEQKENILAIIIDLFSTIYTLDKEEENSLREADNVDELDSILAEMDRDELPSYDEDPETFKENLYLLAHICKQHGF